MSQTVASPPAPVISVVMSALFERVFREVPNEPPPLVSKLPPGLEPCSSNSKEPGKPISSSLVICMVSDRRIRYSTTVLRYGGMHGEMQGKYYRYCSRSIRYSTDLNSENNKFDMKTFELVSEYCTYARLQNSRYNHARVGKTYNILVLLPTLHHVQRVVRIHTRQ